MIPIDPENPIVKLCAEGMRLEQARRPEEAAMAFRQAWEAARDDYEACIAAHFVARHEHDPVRALHWNRESLRRAQAVSDPSRVAGFMSSLHLNVGYAHETLGDEAESRVCYERAVAALDAVEAGPYREVVRSGLERALERVGSRANIASAET